MLHFVKEERRDYLPVFDVTVQDIPEQGSMKLKADIKYKSNWQQNTLKGNSTCSNPSVGFMYTDLMLSCAGQRRNKWICALKNALKEAKIFGPTGDPDAPAGPTKLTLVPYIEGSPTSYPVPSAEQLRTNYNLTDAHADMLSQGTGNIFGDEDEVRMPVPANTAPTSGYATPAGLSGDVRPGVQSAGAAQQEAVLQSRAAAVTAGASTTPQPTRWATAEEIEMRQQPPH